MVNFYLVSGRQKYPKGSLTDPFSDLICWIQLFCNTVSFLDVCGMKVSDWCHRKILAQVSCGTSATKEMFQSKRKTP